MIQLERVWVRCSHWAWIVPGLAVLAVYLSTLSPGVLGGDPGELQFVPAILSLPHPTGTPLYVLLGKMWSLLPLGPSVAWRMNLLAAMSAAAAAALVYQSVYLLRERVAPALSAALCVALGLTFWEQAVLADKYAFNALLVSLVLYLTLRWSKSRSPGDLNLLALCYGLSLTHHRTMLLFAPALLAYVWWHERARLWTDWRRLLRLALLGLAPLLLYLYLPWAEARNLPPGTWHPRTLRQWSDYLLDVGFTGQVALKLDDLGERLLVYAQTLQRDFTWLGVLLGIGGLILQVARRPVDAAFLTLNYVLQVLLAANYRVPRHWVFFIPSFLIWGLWVGEALAGLAAFLQARTERWHVGQFSAGKAILALFAILVVGWPLLPAVERGRSLRESHLGYGTLDVWRQTLKTGQMADRVGQAIECVEPDAVIVCDWEQATPLWYYQRVKGINPGVQIVYPIERLDEAAGRGEPLYIARTLPGVAGRWHPSAVHALVALRDSPLYDLPPQATSTQLDFGGLIALAGFQYGDTDFVPPQVVPLTLYWRALQTPSFDYSVSLRLLDGAGGEVFKVDSQHPVLGMYPTSRWLPGEVVADYYEMQLPPALSPGLYQWGVILYRALPEGGWESLRVNGGETELGVGDMFQVTE